MILDRALELENVSLRYDERVVLGAITWSVHAHERWVIVGANGAGKTTLLRIASLHQHPSTGTVRALGETLGRCDLRKLRTRIGLSSPAMAARLEPSMTASQVVMTARYGALAPWWHTYDDNDRMHARMTLDRFGVGALADHTLETLSAGERQRTLLARAIARDPELLFLDEPTSGLDIGAREQVLSAIAGFADDETSPPVVLVTHHLEEIPRGFTHAMVLRDGYALAQGPIFEVLNDATLSEAFDIGLAVTYADGRFAARMH